MWVTKLFDTYFCIKANTKIPREGGRPPAESTDSRDINRNEVQLVISKRGDKTVARPVNISLIIYTRINPIHLAYMSGVCHGWE